MEVDNRATGAPSVPDAYIVYTRRFFASWSGLYDLFAWPIGFAYRAAARRAVRRPGDRVLDVCTGTGETALRCVARGGRVTGIDVTPVMLRRAQDKLQSKGVDLQLMDARRLGFADHSFDAAVLTFALHDMPRDVRLQVLKEAARVVRERLVVLDYDFPRRQPWRRAMISAIDLYESAYLRNYSRETLSELIAAAGLPGKAKLETVFPGLFSLAVVTLSSAEKD